MISSVLKLSLNYRTLPKYLFIALIFLILISTLNTTFANENDNVLMDNENNILGDDCDEKILLNEGSSDILSDTPDSFNDLKELISSSNGVVNLTKDYTYGSQDNIASGIIIDKTIVINGNGHTIDGVNMARAFQIKADNVVLNNITFVNCKYNLASVILWSGANGIIANSTFKNNIANSYGTIYANGTGLVVDNNWFINNTCIYYGHAVTINNGYSTITNNYFLNSSDKNLCSAIWIDGYDNRLDNNEFANLYSQDYAAIQVGVSYNGNPVRNTIISNSRIYNCSSDSSSIGIQALAFNTLIINCSFANCNGEDSGAIHSYCSSNVTIKNSNFTNCSSDSKAGSISIIGGSNYTLDNINVINSNADSSGGALYISGDNANILNSKIINSTANLFAGAIYFQCSNSLIENVYIENATAFKKNSLAYGGAIFWDRSNSTMRNCTIINSNSEGYGGGLFIQTTGTNSTIENSTFKNNNAGYYGGGIYLNGANSSVKNSYFENNFALHSGGILAYAKNIEITDSNFTKNNADYGGGAIGNVGENTRIINSKFESNHANNYGGALSVTDAYVEGCTFTDNMAVFGGAIYTINSTIKNSEFSGNDAIELGNKVFAINEATIINSDVSGDELYNNLLTESYEVLGTTYNLFVTLDDESKQHVYTDEWYLKDYYSYDNVPLYLDDSFKLFRNRLDSSDISEYLKLLYYYYPGYLTDQILSYTGFYYAERDYSTITNWYVKYPQTLYNQGKRAPDIEIKDDKVVLYKYYMLITPTPHKNSFFFQKIELPIGINVTKETINDMVIVDNVVKFRVNITNTGKYSLTDVFFKELYNKNELEYLDYESNCTWIFNETSNTWTLKDALAINETASIILSFKTLTNGTLINNVTAGFNNKTTKNATSSVKVYRPNMTISKVALPYNVAVGNQVTFEIIVKNTGDMDLTDVTIIEQDYGGLTYAGYHENDAWSYAYVNGKHTWTLKYDLVKNDDEVLFVIFNTTTTGKFSNTVISYSNEMPNKQATADVNVLGYEFTVEKVALTNITALGDQTMFEIIVHNIGETDLENVFIIEDNYDGLIFDHARQATRWNHSLTDDGKHKWTFNEVLPSHEWVFLFMVFNTTEIGNFTNTVIAGSSSTINKTANATVWVNETVHKPEGDIYELNVAITTIHPIVVVGNQTMFEIIVHNVGNTVLHNVTIAEDAFNGLVFDHFIDYTGYWESKFTRPAVSNGLLGAPVFREFTWQMNDELFIGEYTGFFVVFNTTKTGRFENTILGSSDETPEKTASDVVDVVKPEYEISKILLNEDDIYVNEEIYFKITVTNVGQVNLTNLILKELPKEGLEFIGIIDEQHMWTQEGLTFKLNSEMLPREEVEIIAMFKSSIAGTYENIVVSSADNVDDKSDSASVRILERNPIYNISIDTKVIDSPVYVGNTSLVEITIINTGNDELNDAFVKLNLNDALIYLSYTNGSKNWTKNGYIFNLVGKLGVGETATFYVLVNTTKEGNFTNMASTGFNNTVKSDSSFIIEVLKTNNDNDDGDKDKFDDEYDKNNESDDNNSKQTLKHVVDKNATGNPILLLLFILIAIPILKRKF